MRRALSGLFPGRWAQRKTLVGQGNYLENDDTNLLWSVWWQGERMGTCRIKGGNVLQISNNTLSS